MKNSSTECYRKPRLILKQNCVILYSSFCFNMFRIINGPKNQSASFQNDQRRPPMRPVILLPMWMGTLTWAHYTSGYQNCMPWSAAFALCWTCSYKTLQKKVLWMSGGKMHIQPWNTWRWRRNRWAPSRPIWVPKRLASWTRLFGPPWMPGQARVRDGPWNRLLNRFLLSPFLAQLVLFFSGHSGLI